MTVSYENYRRQALHQIDNLAKPPGSLGLLEKQAKQILLAWGTFHRELRPKHIIFAADNGVVQAGQDGRVLSAEGHDARGGRIFL